MATTLTSLICNRFAGIRRINANFIQDYISCSDCQNVELFDTGINAGVGIRNAKGNVSLYDSFAEGEKIIGIFESVQDSTNYCIVYTETTTEGKLYLYTGNSQTPITQFSLGTGVTLSVTGNACGTDFRQGFNDLFMFTNGEEVVKIDMNDSTQARVITLTDIDGATIKGLGFKSFDSRMWIFSKNKIWYSYKGDCTDFNTVESEYNTSAGWIETTKNITAIYPYLGSLAVFHRDSSCLIKADEDDNFSVTDDSPGGCAGYDSLVFHGTDLFFYDDTKKGVFSFQQVVNGDKTLGDNIAKDLQEELLTISQYKLNQIKALSVVLDDRNEVWLMLPASEGKSTILIFDYIHKEWVKRVEPEINCIAVVNGGLLSGGTELLEEYSGVDFSGTFIQSYYYCTPMDFGSVNTLKILYFPPRLLVDTTRTNNFWVRYIKNSEFFKKIKKKLVTTKGLNNVLYWDVGYWDVNSWAPKTCQQVVKFLNSTFKTLEMRIYTENSTQGFCIKNIEFSKVKVKKA